MDPYRGPYQSSSFGHPSWNDMMNSYLLAFTLMSTISHEARRHAWWPRLLAYWQKLWTTDDMARMTRKMASGAIENDTTAAEPQMATLKRTFDQFSSIMSDQRLAGLAVPGWNDEAIRNLPSRTV
ncbi:hypothetical protein PENANT_c031G04361 [Penicillium antarcticum]|uniref:Uncharacterized protein n=1 Tax=Penicillium antarcticum TaxID=416450 RepID=A0A1V6PVR7_9EURO|nr:hypothetical protein PENANT_c031G04361 [Penicillium antarcticum]